MPNLSTRCSGKKGWRLGPEDEFGRPPLAKDLFANRPLFADVLDRFPQCKPIVPRLRDPEVISGNRSIEAVMEDIQTQAETYSRGTSELAATRCYLQQAIGICDSSWRVAMRGVSNHVTLFREIERLRSGNDPVLLVTFNYDTLIESALASFGYHIYRMEDYTNGTSPFLLFKLHGSVNWWQEVNLGIPADINRTDQEAVLKYLVAHALPQNFLDNFKLWTASSRQIPSDFPVFPAIAIPVQSKTKFYCPYDQMLLLRQLLPQVDKIWAIGWSAGEQHFINLLSEYVSPNREIVIVAGRLDHADSVRVALTQRLRYKPEIAVG